MKTIYLLESVNLENKSGVLLVKPESPKNGKWTTINVSLSNLLTHLISFEKYRGLKLGDTFVGTKFTSEVSSPDFGENPFNLVQFMPTEDSDVPMNYQLRMVNEKKAIKVEVLDFYAQKATQWRNRYKRPNAFLRFEKVLVSAMLKDCLNLNVVKP